MKYMKKLALLGMVVAMMATSLTGCGELKDTDTIVTIGDEDVKAGVVNFYARYMEATYETYYASMVGEDMWSQNVSDDETYEESVKSDVIKTIEEMVLIKQHAKEYKVELSDDEKKAITEAAQKFFDDNELASKEKVSGTKKNVEELLTLYALQDKIRPLMIADVDKEVSDEEAAQKSMTYVEFPYYSTDESGQSVEMTDEEKAAAKEKAQALLDGAKGQTDKSFNDYATEAGYSPVIATFDSESEKVNAELLPVVDKLGEGEYTEVVETEAGYFVAQVTSMLDREGTDTKKQDIITEREDKLYDDTIKKWKKDTKIKLHKGNYKKIDFNELGITMMQEEELPYAESSDGAANSGSGTTDGATDAAE